MATSSDIIFYKYSPEIMPEDVLRKLFVGREGLLKSMFKELEKAASRKTPRYYLIVGPRGIGKSHFLMLLYYEIKNKLGSLLIPIKLAEEEYSVLRASDLFLRILEEKPEDTSDILSLKKEDEILDAALEKLKQISKKDDKTYVIFLENLHELFRQFDTKELQKLRSIFQRYDIFSVVASAPMIFPYISDHDEPFYNFFQIQHLGEFSVNETEILIKKIAELENNTKFLEEFEKYKPRIHSLARLTGGSPRLVMLFYEMIARDELESIEKAFFKVIDEHTPYYQDIFQLLTGQRRRIFDILLSSEESLTPKQISEKARIELPTVTTQLRRLERDGYVLSRPRGRHTYYEVRERLFRLWREMRQPFGRKRVSILLEFLQHVYTPEEQKKIFKIKFERLEAGDKTMLRDLCYYAEILPLESKAEALPKLILKLLKHGELEEAAYEIQKLKETAAQTRNKKLEGKAELYEGFLRFSEKKYEEALEAFDKTLEIDPTDEVAILGKVITLAILGRYEELLEIFNKVLEIDPKHEVALSLKGFALTHLGRYKEALEAFNKALEINPKNEFALSRKGVALLSLGRYEEALEAFNKALEISPTEEIALSGKSAVSVILGRHEEALDAAKRAKDLATSEQSKIIAELILIEAYISLDKKTDATLEIEKIKDRVTGQEPNLIENFVELCLRLALDELTAGNRGNGAKLIEMALDAGSGLGEDKVKELVMAFLKGAMESGETPVIRMAVREIAEQMEGEYKELVELVKFVIKLIICAVEIVETKDIQKYYALQVELREVVADIVRMITKSEELIPEEIRRKEGR